MNNDWHRVLAELLGVVAMALVPVVLTAFMAMPLSRGRHPGDAVPQGSAVLRHMT
jgi:ABC-type phosphate/phosphonate transport system permease subunit